MPNPHATRALHAQERGSQEAATMNALLAIAYELRTQNLLKTAEIFATPHDTSNRAEMLNDLFLTTRTIMQERLS